MAIDASDTQEERNQAKEVTQKKEKEEREEQAKNREAQLAADAHNRVLQGKGPKPNQEVLEGPWRKVGKKQKPKRSNKGSSSSS